MPEWVTNDRKEYECDKYGLRVTRDQWRRWRDQFVVGRPRPLEGSSYTVEELEAWGFEGLYRPDPKEGS